MYVAISFLEMPTFFFPYDSWWVSTRYHKTKITIYNLLLQQVFTVYRVKPKDHALPGLGLYFKARGHGLYPTLNLLSNTNTCTVDYKLNLPEF
jgi:hypothetical protein